MNTSNDGSGAVSHPFSVGTDPVVSARVRKELLRTLQTQAKLDPEQAERELDSIDMRGEFVRHFDPLGLAPDILPDLLAAHLLVMWSAVHDAPLPDREVAAGLVRQFTAQISGNPQITDPALRQLMGEALLQEAVLSLGALRVARESASKSKLKEIAESAQRNLLAQRGINLRKTRLTASGMARA